MTDTSNNNNNKSNEWPSESYSPYHNIHNKSEKHIWNVLKKLYPMQSHNLGKSSVYLESNLFHPDHSAGELNQLIRDLDYVTPTLWNKAHNDVIQDYKNSPKRGRPVGSKNKPKVVDKDFESFFESVIGSPAVNLYRFDDLPESSNHVAKPETSNTIEKNTVTDPSAYAIEVSVAARFARQIESTTSVQRHIDKLAITQLSHADDIKSLTNLLEEIELRRPTVVELRTPDLPPVSLGVTHRQFPTLLKMCNARLRDKSRLNVWLHGPAGSGKSSAAELVAKALNLEFYTNGKLMGEHQVLGYQDATGNYISTAFRKAFEFGGVYLFDEIDGSSNEAVTALNGALANALCAFPDKMVRRHPDCVILAGANTTGKGATAEYSGRQKQDDASLDRFVFLHWPIDDALEASITANQEWLQRVRKYRANVKSQGVKGSMVTPRATLYGEALLSAGLDMKQVIDATIKKGMSDAQFDTIDR